MKTLFILMVLLQATLNSFGQACVEIECPFGESEFALLNESCNSGNNCDPNAIMKILTVNHLKHHSFWFRIGQANYETRLSSPIVQYNPYPDSDQCVKLIYNVGNDINLIVFYWVQDLFSGTQNNPTMRGAIINWQVDAVNCSSINNQEIDLFSYWDFDLSSNSANDKGDLIIGSNSVYLLQKDSTTGSMVSVESSSINLVGVLVDNAAFICSILDDVNADNFAVPSQPQSECNDAGVAFQWSETIPANAFLHTIAAGSGIVYLNTPAADFNGDYCVDDDDLLLLLLAYGQQCSVFDLDNSGTVDDMDILELLFSNSGDCLSVSAACVSCVWDIENYCK
ncbi:MAG: hypothetical protein KIT45_10770 [Fimbriimonadia bacterium]|nr:hypothetical protein [Fimbriimonadia bacterium]